MKKTFLIIISTLLGFGILTFEFTSYASPLRLMAMGDMQGIVEDESDYLYDVTALQSIQNNHISLFSGITNYVNTFNKNNLNDFTTDYDRSGSSSPYNVTTAFKGNNGVAIYASYFNQNVDSDMSYFTSTGIDWSYKEYDVTAKKIGYFESSSLGISYKVNDWLIIGATAKNSSFNFHYVERALCASPSIETIENEYDETSTKFYSGTYLRLCNEKAFLSLYSKSSLASVAAGYQFIPGVFSFDFLYDDDSVDNDILKRREAGGITIKPFDNLTCAIGMTQNWFTFLGEKSIISANLGAEYILNNALAVRFGTILKGPYYNHFALSDDNLLDLTFGIGYKIGPCSFELSALYYQDVPTNSFNYWNAVPNPDLSELSRRVYGDHSVSDQHNLLLMTGFEFIF